MSDDSEPGFEAIDAHLSAKYGSAPAMQWGTLMSFAEGGRDPLGTVRAYAAGEERKHWHYVGFGLSELGAKKSEDAERSGWGIELTFRLVRALAEDAPPIWPVVMLQSLARYVIQQKRPFADGHYIAMGGPIAKDTGTALVALSFCLDPEDFGELDGPNGELEFIQAVGITEDELALVNNSNAEGMVTFLASKDPLLVTDLSRASYKADEQAGYELSKHLLEAAKAELSESRVKRQEARALRDAKRAKDQEHRTKGRAADAAAHEASKAQREADKVKRDAELSARADERAKAKAQRDADKVKRDAELAARAAEREAKKKKG